MRLTKKQIEELYEFIKGKNVTKEELQKQFGIDVSGWVSYKIFIPFRRGQDYEEVGKIKMNCYKLVLYKLDQGHKIFLGEINGPHSSGVVSKDDISFSTDPEQLEANWYNLGNNSCELLAQLSECDKKCKCNIFDIGDLEDVVKLNKWYDKNYGEQ